MRGGQKVANASYHLIPREEGFQMTFRSELCSAVDLGQIALVFGSEGSGKVLNYKRVDLNSQVLLG